MKKLRKQKCRTCRKSFMGRTGICTSCQTTIEAVVVYHPNGHRIYESLVKPYTEEFNDMHLKFMEQNNTMVHTHG